MSSAEEQKNTDKTAEPKKESSARWWEFYAVRYAMGTVLGGVIFYILTQHNPLLHPLLLEPKDGTGALDTARLTLLAAYGLVYCYIASAPTLVFHSGRFLLMPDAPTRTKWWRQAIIIAPPLIAALLTYKYGPESKSVVAVSTFLLTLIVWLQVMVAFGAIFRSRQLYEFYQQLSQRRIAANQDILDSYRHLREHGNSFSIVVLELAFAAILYGAGVAAPIVTGGKANGIEALFFHGLVLFIWIAPASLVWVIGTLLERRFSGYRVDNAAPDIFEKLGKRLRTLIASWRKAA